MIQLIFDIIFNLSAPSRLRFSLYFADDYQRVVSKGFEKYLLKWTFWISIRFVPDIPI